MDPIHSELAFRIHSAGTTIMELGGINREKKNSLKTFTPENCLAIHAVIEPMSE